MKFLFTADKLSVQVHPDDEAAQRVGKPFGKTECWYVLEAKPGAQVALGLKPGVSLEDFGNAITGVQAEELLNWIEVQRGDMLYVGAGTVHTIGAGLTLLETQQASDVTYRLYDYGRPRELHIERRPGGDQAEQSHRQSCAPAEGDDGRDILVRSPFFQVEKIHLQSELAAEVTPDSPHIIVAMNGSGILESAGMEPVSFARGEAVVVPAAVPRIQCASAMGVGDHAHVAAGRKAAGAGNNACWLGGAGKQLVIVRTSTIGQIS